MPPLFTRRHFLASSAAAASALFFRDAAAAADPGPSTVDVAFWQVSDTHFLCDTDDVSRIDKTSADVNAEVVRLLNALPGSDLPPAMGGGALPKPIGVIHTGDTIDSGNKYSQPFVEMQRTEWRAFEEAYGLSGTDGRLKYPVYELYGNHDAPKGIGLALDHMIERNKNRPGVTRTSKNGVHYSWDWQGVRFISLGITVGSAGRTPRKPFFNSLDSYDYLKSDLAEHVGTSGRPVVLCHHIDIAGNTKGCNPAAKLGPGRIDWDPCDVAAFYDAIRPNNVIACIYGHTHQRNVFKWDGASAKAAAGIDCFNCDDAAHFAGGGHGILHYHLTDTKLVVREFATKNHWKTAEWTQMWVKPIEMRRVAPDVKAAPADGGKNPVRC